MLTWPYNFNIAVFEFPGNIVTFLFIVIFTVDISYLDSFRPSERSNKSPQDVDMKGEIPEECRVVEEGWRAGGPRWLLKVI